ncbi:MAG: hypothetical protein ACYC6Z_03300 [Thermoleophilia bacterium]
MPRTYLYLILVWSLVCASGLGIFLFQTFGPRIDVEADYTGLGLAVAVAFWVLAWALPVSVLFVRGRRQKA